MEYVCGIIIMILAAFITVINKKVLGVKHALTFISYEALPVTTYVIHYTSGGFGSVNVTGFSVTFAIVIYFAGTQSGLSR
jgi:hypothetical protein